MGMTIGMKYRHCEDEKKIIFVLLKYSNGV